jgi:hypothetical protein
MRSFLFCSNADAAPLSLLTWIFIGVNSVTHATVSYVLMLESMRQQLSRAACYAIVNLTRTANVWHRLFGFRREGSLYGVYMQKRKYTLIGLIEQAHTASQQVAADSSI